MDPVICSYNKKINLDPVNIHVDKISINIGKNVLFDDTILKISNKVRYGLIGRNGYGKTTLLKCIFNKKIPVHEDIDILYVEQEMEPSTKSVFDTIFESDTKKLDIIKKNNKLEKQLDDNDDVLDNFLENQKELQAINIDEDKIKIRKILLGLGFSVDDQNKPVNTFSGGWRMRISLARALYLEPTLLLLDEPTNHLDLDAVLWLTEYLSKWKKSLLIVSHDQNFLNEVCTCIINIENSKLKYYNGNYSNFKYIYNQNYSKLEKEWNKLEKQINTMRKKNKTKKEINELLKKKETEGIYKPNKQSPIQIEFYDNNQVINPLIEFDNVSFSYDDNKNIFNDVNFLLNFDSRITLTGKNGIGKSTLFKLITKDITPTEGNIYIKQNLRIGLYHQHFESYLPLNVSAVEYLKNISKLEQEDYGKMPLNEFIRKQLGKIGLRGNSHNKKIGELSGGQKARVALVSLILSKPHILLLDEPTNHLDIESIESLINGINNFNGSVFIITHDYELITKTNCDIWVLSQRNITNSTK